MKTRIMCLILCITMLLPLFGCSNEAVSLTELPDPAESVENFFTCLENEEYSAADELVYNYVTLGMIQSEYIDDTLMQVFYRELNRQRKVSIVMEPQVTGKSAVMAIQVTTLDLRNVYDPLIENVKQTIKRMQYVGEDTEGEDIILAVATDELSTLLENDTSLTTTGIFALELVYTEGIWKLVISDELYSAIIGYAV